MMSVRSLGNLAASCAFAVAFAASSVNAQEQLTLAVEEAYVHPHSNIEVPTSLAGYQRNEVHQYVDDGLDVGINFRSADESQLLTLYIFRHTNGSVPVWFAQAQSVIEGGEKFDKPTAAIGPVSFTPPGASQASGLVGVFQPGSASNYKSTGVALWSVGEWYVKLRASSATQTPAELYRTMTDAMAQLAVPQSDTQAVAAVVDCSDKLSFGKASRDARGDAADAVIGSLIGSILGDLAEEKQEEAGTDVPAVYCRDVTLDPSQAVYRPDASKERYLLAIGDNGNGIAVGPELRIDGISPGSAKKPRYLVVLHTAKQRVNFISQDRLPSPKRVIELLQTNHVMSSQATWGDERPLEVRSDALK